MTAYAARTDLTRFGISEKALTNVSTETQDAALEAASRVADSYLRSRYALPLAGYGDDLKRAVCAIAAWDLLSTRGYDPHRGSDEAVRMRADDAKGWLKDISAGKAAVSGGVTTPGPSRPSRVATAASVRSDSKRGW